MSDTEQPAAPGGAAEAGFGIDDSKIQIIRHPDNAGLKRDNDLMQGEEDKPAE